MIYGIIWLALTIWVWFMVREMDKATPVCGSCRYYKSVILNTQNTTKGIH